MSKDITILPKGRTVTLLTSYCGGTNENCTNIYPCETCISMANTFELMDDVCAMYVGQVSIDGMKITKRE